MGSGFVGTAKINILPNLSPRKRARTRKSNFAGFYRSHAKDDGRLCFQSVHTCRGGGGGGGGYPSQVKTGEGLPRSGPDEGGTPARSRLGGAWPGPHGGTLGMGVGVGMGDTPHH